MNITIGITDANGYGGDDSGFNLKWATDPKRQIREMRSRIEVASGRKDGWTNRHDVRHWGFKIAGVSDVSVASGSDRAPHLGFQRIDDVHPHGRVERSACMMQLDALYLGSTWSGDNRESPRAVADPNQVARCDVVSMLRDIFHYKSSPMRPRVCFDQSGGLSGTPAFQQLGVALSAVEIEVFVEAMPRDPQDLRFFGGWSRYANLMERRMLEPGAYPLPKGSRVTIGFDGKILRDENGPIGAADVDRVVKWADGIAEIELMLVGHQHAKPVIDWAFAHGIL